jgi:hypothetical protein
MYIYVDGSLKWTSSSSPCKIYKGTRYTRQYELSIEKDTHIKIVWQRSSTSSSTEATVLVWGKDLSPALDDCLSTKDCMKILGAGSSDAFDLRNDNRRQRACLNGKLNDSLCQSWRSCLQNSGGFHGLRTLLRAVFSGSSSSLLEQNASRLVRSHDASTANCQDPSVSDPETWDCDCFENMKQTCGGVDQACFNRLMCSHPNICSSWKESNCGHFSSSMLEIGADGSTQEKTQKRLMRRATVEETATDLNKEGLDSSLEGKCSW